MKLWIINVLVALDQMINALLGGWADETISSRAYRMKDSGTAWRLVHGGINLLLFIQPDHCRIANDYERNRWQMPPDLR
jgi:hypothetical protein